MQLKLPYKAISTNEMYAGRKVTSAKYKRFQKQVSLFLAMNYPSRKKLEGNLCMQLEVGFSNPASDLSNALKSIEDTIATHFGFNDKQIVSHKLEKYIVDKGSEYMLITLRKTKKDIDRRSKTSGKRAAPVRIHS